MIQPIGPFQCDSCGTEGRVYHITQVTHLDANGEELLQTFYACPECFEELKAMMDEFVTRGFEE
ncbi:MAG TPA: hypothetical protein PLD09_09355 [Methanomassiliicoccaceae archaeon]|jgi:DNA-directed RNA polymerase subunit M/transcription elongation factor TFIIS|nr:hypothetical protein AOA80_03700 [Methanomassiliicoccales archaeon RumEn M1]HOB39336.1 hypothetical protein [Methanomassiliicoccaceae archaeon]HQA22054.1 hypothetical protein [Methanomassiliicoccaceae archaeon]